jgi:hypothetical protein
MLVDGFVDNLIHSSRTGDQQAVGKFVHRWGLRQAADKERVLE